MPILLNTSSRIVCLGMDSPAAIYHMQQALAYGSNIVGGVVPTKGGQEILGRPLFETVADAKKKTHCNVALLFVPKEKAKEAILEAEYAQVRLIICPTRDIPIQDMSEVLHVLRKSKSSILIGPNSPGIITPGECKAGLMPGYIFKQGCAGIVSTSHTLMYEIALQTTRAGLGQSTCMGLGSGPMFGTSFVDILDLFQRDPWTEIIISLGASEGLDTFAAKGLQKPVLVYLPFDHTHSLKGKDDLLRQGVVIVDNPSRIAEIAQETLSSWKLKRV